MSEASAPKRVTRRTVAKGAAWTIPAITVAAPTAAAAMSPEPVEITAVASSCKHPGGGQGNDYPQAYHILFMFRNTSNVAVTFTLPGSATLPGGVGSSEAACVPNSGDATPGQSMTVTVPANSPTYYVVVHYYSNSSGSGVINFPYTYAGPDGSGVAGGDTFDGSITGSPCSPAGIPDDHPCVPTGAGTVTDPVCVPSPTGSCTP